MEPADDAQRQRRPAHVADLGRRPEADQADRPPPVLVAGRAAARRPGGGRFRPTAPHPFWGRVAPSPGDRMAVFAALGLDDAHHHRYVEYLQSRTYICNIWRKSRDEGEAPP